MEKTNQTLTLPNKFIEVSEKLNNSIMSVLGQESVLGFQKAFIIANAIKELKVLLTPEYMAPIMELQGNKLGFKTDKDKEGGYKVEEVKNCLIEAVLIGLQPFNNEFNIISGQMYPTKEGMGSLLKKIAGLKYEVIPSLPRINADKSGAAIVMKIKWSVNNSPEETRDIEIPVKMNASMGVDAVIGKATRKARAWLFSYLTGNEISDGDVQDVEGKVMSSKINATSKSAEEIELNRIKLMISDCATLEDLDLLQSSNPEVDASLFEAQKQFIESQKK